MTKRKPEPQRKKMDESLQHMRSHYGLAKRKAAEQNRNVKVKNDIAIRGILASAKKHLKVVNEERAKHYQKPLSLAELIEIIRESE